MWEKNWRATVWSRLNEPFDLVVIGGGITGAGIFREAVRHSLKVLLVEQKDFAWGTSSRSSKLVHGGLRYLASGQIRLTWNSVRERENLLAEAPGLVEPLGFLMATYQGDKPGRWTYAAGLSVYDLMALQWSHRHYSSEAFRLLAPHINTGGLQGGFRYEDAQTDDARLVLRVLQEGLSDGGLAINYVAAQEILRENGQVSGVLVQDSETGATATVQTQAVINATGAWADRLRQSSDTDHKIRPLRGSHLIFAGWRLPVAQAIAFLHPQDRRPVFAFPWEGVTLVGTTDLDESGDLNTEPRISPAEVAYLMAAVTHQFPALALTLEDVIATFAGVRPVLGSGKEDPSKEHREHVVWQEQGLLTVTGGKLTTFRIIALDALRALGDLLPPLRDLPQNEPVFDMVNTTLPASADRLDEMMRRRLSGRYGVYAATLLESAQPADFDLIPNTLNIWAELRWAARSEGVVHLDDLLLRRVRLGLLLPEGGLRHLDRIRALCQPELGWTDAQWEREVERYRDLWRASYGLPAPNTIPDWRAMSVSNLSRAVGSPRRAKGVKWGLPILAALLVMRLLRKNPLLRGHYETRHPARP